MYVVRGGGYDGSRATYIFPALSTPRIAATMDAPGSNRSATDVSALPRRGEDMGNTIGGLVQLAVGQPAVTADHGEAIRIPSGVSLEDRSKRGSAVVECGISFFSFARRHVRPPEGSLSVTPDKEASSVMRYLASMSSTSCTSVSICAPGAPPDATSPLTRWSLPSMMSPAMPWRGMSMEGRIVQRFAAGS